MPAVLVRPVAVGLPVLGAEEERKKRKVGVGAQHDEEPLELLILPSVLLCLVFFCCRRLLSGVRGWLWL